MEIRTDRLGVLVDQLTDSKSLSADRLAGLTAGEYLFGAYPYGLDPQIPFIGVIRWTNRELIHHLAEVALLRDLSAASAIRSTAG